MQTLILAFLLGPFQGDEITISSAGPATYIGDVVTYRDDVRVSYRDMSVQTELLSYDRATETLVAEGGVTFVRGDERLAGSRLELNVPTRTGVLWDASGVLAPGFLVEAREIHRLENGQYELFDATITSCEDPCRRGWEWRTPRTRVDPGSGLSSWNSVLRVEGVPVFYLPYLRAPAETRSRATGFLLPQTSTSTTKGRSVSESYFWAINRSADLLVTGEYFTRRGFAGAARFRAVPNAESRIEISGFAADDRKARLERGEGEGGVSARVLAYTSRNRLRAVADLNMVSSLTFRQVYGEGLDLISSPVDRSQAFLTSHGDSVSYSVAYSRQGTFFSGPVSQSINILRKLPSFELSVHPRRLGDAPLYVGVDGSVAAVHRRDAARESPPFVGRVDVFPQVEIPVLRGPIFSWSHRVGLRNTYYSHSGAGPADGGPLNRTVLDYQSEFAGPSVEKQYDRWRHVIEPFVEHRYVRGADRFEQILRVDDVDLVVDTHEVRYGLTNRIFTDREIVSWTLAQKYFADPEFGGALAPGRDNVFEPTLDLTGFGFADEPRRFSPLVSLLRVSPQPGVEADLHVDYDTARREFRAAGIIGRYRAGPTTYALSHYFIRRSPVQFPSNQIRATVAYRDSGQPGFSASFGFAYNVHENVFQNSITQLSYNAECYGLHLEMTQFDVGPRRESRIRFAFTLKNLGSIGTLRRPDDLF